MPNPPKENWITVVGSLNMDLVVRCKNFPRPGETINAISYQQIPGGKGANQAVSASLACQGTEAKVRLVGRVGQDSFGDSLLESIKSKGVDTEFVLRSTERESGLAFITVQDDGQNSIAIVAGANAELDDSDIEKFRNYIETSQLIILQFEIPLQTIEKVIEIAKGAGVPILLDPAPIPDALPESMLDVDIITPNEHEAARLTGVEISSSEDLLNAAQILRRKGTNSVVITLGEKGSFILDERGPRMIPPYSIQPIDTTAAGDAFAGAFAVRWLETGDIDQAVRWGNAAGALAASRPGAQPSMGTRNEIETFGRF